MFAAVHGMSVVGLQAHLIRVEVDVANGLPGFDIVGLPATAVREARERVRSALRNSGFQFPLQRVTVNLAPADLRKEGSGLDLPIAVGILAATGQCSSSSLEGCVFAGELSLEGYLRPVPGILAMAASLSEMNKGKIEEEVDHYILYNEGEKKKEFSLIVPPDNLVEARLISGVQSLSSMSLGRLIDALQMEDTFEESQNIGNDSSEEADIEVDWSDIRGQFQAKRALVIAAAGGHNLIMVGPPGSGKTLLAKAFARILPPLSSQESMEVTKLYSIVGLLNSKGRLITRRPFRHPHHSATAVGIIGGGREVKPGELSLANHGVLYLDELPEFSREVLESLRQPLEDRQFVLTRQKGSIKYPARVSVIASMNPCPCGFYGDKGKDCNCTPKQINNYRGRISGPMLDRFDIHVEVPRLSYDELQGNKGQPKSQEDTSNAVQRLVLTAREIQWDRLGMDRTNAEMSPQETREYCKLNFEGERLMKKIFNANNFSARSHDRFLRVARTIADLGESDAILPEHLAEAMQYRVLDRPIL